MKGIVKPNVKLLSINPEVDTNGMWEVEFEMETFNGKLNGYLKIEERLIQENTYTILDLIVDELLKDLQGRELI